MQSYIGQDGTNQCDQWEIKSFSQHLGADENIGLVGRKAAQDRLMSPLLPGCVPIPAQSAGVREDGLDLALHALCAGAVLADALTFTIRAHGRHVALVATVMACQRYLRAVVG